MNRDYAKKQQRIVSLLKQGETKTAEFQIGMEIEHIVVDAITHKSVDYYEDSGIESILKDMAPLGYEVILEGESVVGLKHPDYIITLEPGGQVEISIKPCRELPEIYSIYWTFLDHILPILKKNKQWMMCIGYHPKSMIRELPFNPKKRYRFMSDYLEKTGRYAHYMMKGTASLQVVIDYQNQADFIEKFRVAHFLMPFLALLSDNAPFFEGSISEQFSMRTAIWDETDPARCALIPGVMDQEFGYSAYADYILRTPPILIQKEQQFIGTGDRKTIDLEGLEHFSDEETDHLLSMVFPDVRVRRYIEIRMADSLPLPLSFAFTTLIKNLFYQETSLKYLYHLSLSMTDGKLCQLRKDMQAEGFDARFGGTTCQQMLLALLDLAKQGSNQKERTWLQHLELLVAHKETPALYSRRMVEQRGLPALEWCAAHTWIKEEV